MNINVRTAHFLATALGLLLAHASVAESKIEARQDPHAHHRAAVDSSATQRSLEQFSVPDITMTNQHGARISLPDLFDTDRPVMVNFIFTTCTAICPMMTSIFGQVQAGLGDEAGDVLMVSVSIDPEEDSPEILAEYAERFRAGPQWQFLTGSLKDSITVQEAFAAYRGDKMNHAPMTLLREDASSSWVRIDGFAPARQLEAEIRNML